MDFGNAMNPYEHYEQTAQRFRALVQKKKEMEETFRPDMYSEYNNVKADLVRTAIELLQIGVQKRLDENNVYLTLDDGEYIISRSEMMKSMDKGQWDSLFTNDNVQTIKAVIDESVNDSTENNNNEQHNSYNDDNDDVSENFIQNNPLAAFMTALFTPFAGGNGNGQPDMNKMALSLQQAFQPKRELSDEVGSIQKRILKLERQRDAAVDASEKYQHQIEAIKNEQDELLKQCETDIKAAESKLKEFEEKLAKVEEEKKSLAEDSDKKKKELEETIRNKQREFDLAQNESARKLKEEKNRAQSLEDSLNKKIDNLNRQVSDANKKADDSEKQCKDISRQLDDTKQEANRKIRELKDEAAGLKEEIKKNAVNASETLEKSVKKARDDADAAARKIKEEYNKEIEELRKKLKEAEDKAASLDGIKKDFEGKLRDKDKRIAELEEKAAESDSLRKEVEAGKKRQGELLDKISEQEKVISSLEELAYSDRKVGAKNNNAFNRDFPALDKNSISLIMTGVRNMKHINDKYGRTSGDKMLKVAAKEYIDTFGSDNVYRVFSDEFAIIADSDFNECVLKITAVKETLAAQGINIVYGIAVGSKCENSRKMVDEAQGAMLIMKDSPLGSAEIPAEDPSVDKHRGEEPEELDMSDMLSEYMQTEN